MAAIFIACYKVFNHRIWLRNFIMGLHVVDGIDRQLKLFYDNKSAMIYSNNNRA